MKPIKQVHHESVKKSIYVKMLSFFRWTFSLALLGFSVFIFVQIYLEDNESQMKPDKFDIPSSSGLQSTYKEPEINKAAIIQEFIEKQQSTISGFNQKDTESISFAIKELETYFDEKNYRIDAFIDDIFDMGSKAKMAYYYLKGDGSLEKYLEHMTGHYLGTPRGLETKLAAITSSLKADLKRNHNQLMLAVEADLKSVPYALHVSSVSTDSLVNNFNVSFNETLAGLLPRTVGVQLGVESASLAIDAFVAPMIARGIIGFLTSRGVIAAGTVAAEGTAVGASSALAPYTFGASIVAGVILAIAIDYTCNKIAKADAREKVVQSLKTWKEATVASYSEGIKKGVADFQDARMQAIQKAFSDEVNKIAYGDQKQQLPISG